MEQQKAKKTPVFNSFFQVAAEKTVRVCKLQWMSHAQIFLGAVSPTHTFHPALGKHKTEKNQMEKLQSMAGVSV